MRVSLSKMTHRAKWMVSICLIGLSGSVCRPVRTWRSRAAPPFFERRDDGELGDDADGFADGICGHGFGLFRTIGGWLPACEGIGA
jgi:hypothetical protein